MPSPDEKPVVLITGAGGGLGLGLVQAFAAAGWRVVAGTRASPEQAGTECVVPVRLDVTQAASVQAAVKEIVDRWGRMDALINNAGVTRDGLLLQMSEDDWDEVLAINLKGAFLCAQAVLRLMLKQRAGHIINVGSWSGRAGAYGQANYAAAKAGLFGLTTSLAREVGSRNIRVNAVLPGVLPTRMTAHLDEDELGKFAAANALGRINSVDEVARFIVFLTSMGNVSGQLFQLDSRVGAWA